MYEAKEMDILVRMCEECVKKLKGKSFKSASRHSFKTVRICANPSCFKLDSFVVTLHLPEKKVIE